MAQSICSVTNCLYTANNNHFALIFVCIFFSCAHSSSRLTQTRVCPFLWTGCYGAWFDAKQTKFMTCAVWEYLRRCIINAAAGVSTSSSRYLKVNCSNYAIKCACLHCIWCSNFFILVWFRDCLFFDAAWCSPEGVITAITCIMLSSAHILNETKLWRIIDNFLNLLSRIVWFKFPS